MAPGIMHILFVHSDGFVIKEFHFRFFPSVVGEGGEGGWAGVEAGAGGLSGTIKDNSQVEFDRYTFSRRTAERETQAHMLTLIPACKPLPRPCRAPGRNSSILALEAPRRFEAKQV